MNNSPSKSPKVDLHKISGIPLSAPLNQSVIPQNGSANSSRDLSKSLYHIEGGTRNITIPKLAQQLMDIKRLQVVGKSLQNIASSFEKKKNQRVQLHRIKHRLAEAHKTINTLNKTWRYSGIDPNDFLFDSGLGSITMENFSRKIKDEKTSIENKVETHEKIGSSSQPLTGVEILGAAGAAAAGTLVNEVIKKIIEAFNGSDDDQAREWVQSSTCDAINAVSDADIMNRLEALCSGSTDDDDEDAILRILTCLPFERRRSIMSSFTLERFDDAVDGEEWDKLVFFAQECGLINFDQMDDDASRIYIERHSEAQLAQLPLSHVRQLCLNFFDGSTGDEDEDAILKLLNAQSGARLRELVSMPGMSTDEFDDEVDGSQWRQLKALFHTHGIDAD